MLFELGVVDGFNGDDVVVSGAGTTGNGESDETGAVDDVRSTGESFIGFCVWQTKPFPNKTTIVASVNNIFHCLIRVSPSA